MATAMYPFDEGFAINGAKPHYQPSFRLVPVHYDITIDCKKPENREADAVVVITVQGR
jgi:hypothetical protein